MLERKSRKVRLAKLLAKTSPFKKCPYPTYLSRYPNICARPLPMTTGQRMSNIWISIKCWAHNRSSVTHFIAGKKGLLKNVIGLVRVFLPKSTDFAIITKEQLKRVENLINERPRKCLGYKTPNEDFTSSVALHC